MILVRKQSTNKHCDPAELDKILHSKRDRTCQCARDRGRVLSGQMVEESRPGVLRLRVPAKRQQDASEHGKTTRYAIVKPNKRTGSRPFPRGKG